MATGMPRKELEGHLKTLQKSGNNPDHAPATIAILESLKKDVKATEELLRATKAGMIVAKLKSNPNRDLGRLASEIITKWKKAVQVQQAAAKKQKLGGSSPPPKAGSTSSPAPTAMPAAATESKGYAGDIAKRRWETDKVDTKRTGVPSRDACIGLLYNGLAFMSTQPSLDILLKALDVEKAAFEALNGDTPEYRAKLRSLFQNLKNKDNRELGQQVLSGDITPAKFVVMTHDELKSSKQVKEDQKFENENMKKAQVPMAEKSISDALRCGRCGQKKVSYSQAQTRSADEPMTTFCECTVCGNRWKFS